VVAREYVPDSGDLIWLDFTPQGEREQAGRRPAVVFSPRSYNDKTNLAVVCPVTSHVKGYPFQVTVPPGLNVRGPILADHLKNLDWRQRQAQKAGRIPRAVLEQVRERIAALLEIA
jgi:mRNA interferase MazF